MSDLPRPFSPLFTAFRSRSAILHQLQKSWGLTVRTVEQAAYPLLGWPAAPLPQWEGEPDEASTGLADGGTGGGDSAGAAAGTASRKRGLEGDGVEEPPTKRKKKTKKKTNSAEMEAEAEAPEGKKKTDKKKKKKKDKKKKDKGEGESGD